MLLIPLRGEREHRAGAGQGRLGFLSMTDKIESIVMTRIITTILAIFLSFVAFGQGTFIGCSLNNANMTPIIKLLNEKVLA